MEITNSSIPNTTGASSAVPVLPGMSQKVTVGNGGDAVAIPQDVDFNQLFKNVQDQKNLIDSKGELSEKTAAMAEKTEKAAIKQANLKQPSIPESAIGMQEVKDAKAAKEVAETKTPQALLGSMRSKQLGPHNDPRLKSKKSEDKSEDQSAMALAAALSNGRPTAMLPSVLQQASAPNALATPMSNPSPMLNSNAFANQGFAKSANEQMQVQPQQLAALMQQMQNAQMQPTVMQMPVLAPIVIPITVQQPQAQAVLVVPESEFEIQDLSFMNAPSISGFSDAGFRPAYGGDFLAERDFGQELQNGLMRSRAQRDFTLMPKLASEFSMKTSKADIFGLENEKSGNKTFVDAYLPQVAALNAATMHAGRQSLDERSAALQESRGPEVLMGSQNSSRVDLMNSAQLSQEISSLARNGGGSVRVQVNPEHLGELVISVKGSGPHVSVKLEAQTSDAQRILTDSLPELRRMLVSARYDVDSLEVSHAKGSAAVSVAGWSSLGSPMQSNGIVMQESFSSNWNSARDGSQNDFLNQRQNDQGSQNSSWFQKRREGGQQKNPYSENYWS